MRGTAVIVVILAIAPIVVAQAPAQKPAFEVASIKPNRSVSAGGAYSNLGQRGGHVSIIKFSLRMLMGQAYELPSLSDAFDRIVGSPTWAE